MESVEDGKGHRNVRYYGPRPQTVEVKLNWVRLGFRLFQRVNSPHSEIGDEEKGDDLSSRFSPNLFKQKRCNSRCCDKANHVK